MSSKLQGQLRYNQQNWILKNQRPIYNANVHFVDGDGDDGGSGKQKKGGTAVKVQ